MVLRLRRILLPLLAAIPSTVAAQQPAVAIPPPLDPDAPLAPLPDLGVAWPDLNVRDPLEAVPAGSVAKPSETPRYLVVLAGVDDLPVVRQRFDELSVLRENDGKPANVAQINRRARDDVQLLNTIMRSEGYYDATIESEVVPVPGGADRVTVTLRVTPGTRYAFSDVKLQGLGSTGEAGTLAQSYGITRASPVVAEDVLAGQTRLIEKLKRTGYPFAKVPDPSVTVDHATRDATLDLTVDPGGRRNFGAIRMEGGKPPFDARHAGVIARWKPGQLYDQYLVDDFKRAVIATGLVSQVRVNVVEGRAPGTVDLATTLDPAPFRTIAGELGYGTGEGFRLAGSWQHRNFVRPEGAVTLRGVAGTREQLLGVALRMNNFRRRDQVLNARVLASHENKLAYDADTFELAGSIERQTTIIWQKPWSFSVGAELLASNERNVDPTRGALVRRTFFIGALPASLSYDGSDNLLDPTRGYRVSGRISPEVSLQGSTFGYVRSQLDASVYVPVGGKVVVAARTRLGATAGAALTRIAPSRLFYAGGGGSVRGFGYQEIGPLNALGQPTGGRSLAEFSLEARVRLPVLGGNFGVVPFVDAGQVYDSVFPRFTGLRVGVGIGLRYYSNFGPIRIDVGTPLARRPNESRIAVQVSLGQAF